MFPYRLSKTGPGIEREAGFFRILFLPTPFKDCFFFRHKTRGTPSSDTVERTNCRRAVLGVPRNITQFPDPRAATLQKLALELLALPKPKSVRNICGESRACSGPRPF